MLSSPCQIRFRIRFSEVTKSAGPHRARKKWRKHIPPDKECTKMSLKGDTRKPALENLLSLATFARKPAPLGNVRSKPCSPAGEARGYSGLPMIFGFLRCGVADMPEKRGCLDRSKFWFVNVKDTQKKSPFGGGVKFQDLYKISADYSRCEMSRNFVIFQKQFIKISVQKNTKLTEILQKFTKKYSQTLCKTTKFS